MNRLTKRTLHIGLDELARGDAHIAKALHEVGYPPLRRRPEGFGTLLRAMVGQQLSVASAGAIWGRLEMICRPVEAPAFLALHDSELRAIGFSRQKVSFTRSLAEMVGDGRVRLDRLGQLDDRAAAAELVQIKGIGRWTAEIYLLSALGRPDVFPADDVALMTGAQYLKNLANRPDKRQLSGLAEAWRPHRSAAAHLLWHFYRCRRGTFGDVI